MSDRVKAGYSISRESIRRLIRLQKATSVSKSRLLDESIKLYHIVRLAKHPVICTPTIAGIEISEVPQEQTA